MGQMPFLLPNQQCQRSKGITERQKTYFVMLRFHRLK